VGRLGIEGLVLFTKDATAFDAENYTLSVGDQRISVFDKVLVSIEVEKDRNTQRGKVKMGLVSVIA
jgi:exosome complex exonuclease DIS3/RRP44